MKGFLVLYIPCSLAARYTFAINVQLDASIYYSFLANVVSQMRTRWMYKNQKTI